jgi:hypothetical protein
MIAWREKEKKKEIDEVNKAALMRRPARGRPYMYAPVFLLRVRPLHVVTTACRGGSIVKLGCSPRRKNGNGSLRIATCMKRQTKKNTLSRNFLEEYYKA